MVKAKTKKESRGRSLTMEIGEISNKPIKRKPRPTRERKYPWKELAEKGFDPEWYFWCIIDLKEETVSKARKKIHDSWYYEKHRAESTRTGTYKGVQLSIREAERVPETGKAIPKGKAILLVSLLRKS